MYCNWKEKKAPDRPFHKLRASRSRDWPILCRPYDGFETPKLSKGGSGRAGKNSQRKLVCVWGGKKRNIYWVKRDTPVALIVIWAVNKLHSPVFYRIRYLRKEDKMGPDLHLLCFACVLESALCGTCFQMSLSPIFSRTTKAFSQIFP